MLNFDDNSNLSTNHIGFKKIKTNTGTRKLETTLTIFSHDEQEIGFVNLSFALAISGEPQRNRSPYIKAFDSSIIL